MKMPFTKSVKYSFITAILAVSVMVISTAFSSSKESPATEPIKVIQQNGRTLKVYNFEGLEPYFNRDNDTTYVINFWSTWCKPCIKELPHFEAFALGMQDQKFKMILVSLDFPAVYEKSLAAFMNRMLIRSECLILDDPDANSWIPKVDSTWSGAIPATVIYNKSKNKRFFHEGYLEEKKLKQVVGEMLSKSDQ